MTINNTDRSDLSETAAKVHGWKRESFGVGYSTDRFTRADNTIEVTWREEKPPIVTINGAVASMGEVFALVRSDVSLRDTLRIVGSFHGWSRARLGKNGNGDQYWRDGEKITVTYRDDDNAIRVNVNGAAGGEIADALAMMRTPRGTTPTQRLTRQIAGDYERVPCDIIDKPFPEVHVKIGTFEDGYSLWWSDRVANAFMEWHPTLSAALIRFAALMHCKEAEWSIVFVDAGEFELAAQEFFQRGVQ